ncbi:MAG: hypothetical protein ACFFD4_39895 [Candidatus Odinarchaeota archaeon]
MTHEETLSFIEKYLRIFRIESCFLIYFYLMIYGKKIPVHLKSELGISKATVFRSLGFLIDAGFVGKEEIDTVSDKRYNTYYFSSKNIQEICNINISPDCEEYARASGKTSILNEWKTTMENSPSIFSNALVKLFELKRSNKIQKPRAIYVNGDSSKLPLEKKRDMKQKRRIRVFTVTESPEEDIFLKLQNFLSSLNLKEDHNVKSGEKMKMPLSLVIDLIEF